jgi:hypothetical protein
MCVIILPSVATSTQNAKTHRAPDCQYSARITNVLCRLYLHGSHLVLGRRFSFSQVFQDPGHNTRVFVSYRYNLRATGMSPNSRTVRCSDVICSHSSSSVGPNVTAEWFSLLIRCRDVRGSKLDPDTSLSSPTFCFCSLSP